MAPTARRLREFREAVHALSDDPTTRNVKRYLAASRALDGIRVGRRRRGAPSPLRGRPTGSPIGA